MKIRVPDYFKEFKCIASECEDTCCAGWEIVIDDETHSKYQRVSGDFGKRLRDNIVNRDGENIFVLKGDDCAFLNESKMCDIYTELGADSLCYTCRQFPRYTEEFGGLREIGISLSCPEAARIILRDNKKVEFEVSEVEEEITSYNDINAMLFIYLLQSRKIVFDILQNRDIVLEDRASLIIKFTSEIQAVIDENNIMAIKAVNEKYLNNDIRNEIINNLSKYKGKGHIKYNNIYEFFKVFKELKHINSKDPLGLHKVLKHFWQCNSDAELYLDKHKQFNQYYKDKMYKFENLLVYFVFRYFMKAVFDYDVSAKVKTAVVSYLMIKELFVFRWMESGQVTDEDAVDIMHMYSKDVEHLEENIENLAEIFETNDVFNLDGVLSVLMN
ncbi:flagellin lysine-N-methylase [Clostridium sp. YIM B02505]|uniref:Flagellin lysine-N-methylase n=1 Tax=Clostridium yunnanense TaxID=2800325 RepID=A0ABS1ESJ0_9CLOT|nr:flagellin lysine-N-methylase [Clostridium yunnanense]MBK1812294.1 flagellin lysine-N-methylase [Clostridium yunnanense]